MRAVIYARYSTDKQRVELIEDQFEVCRRYALERNWTVVQVYSDAAVSGAVSMRPGFNQMLSDARQGCFDVLVCEAVDRLGRNLSDVASAYDQLTFNRVQVYSLGQGLITMMHIGIMGTMAQMALADTREKVRRGQTGRVKAGKIPCGLAYGYEVLPPPPGQTDGGERGIKLNEKCILLRIFNDYAAGKSPQHIANALNAEGVPGPGGRE